MVTKQETRINQVLYNSLEKVAHYFSEKVNDTYQLITHPKRTIKNIYKEALKEGAYFAAYAVAIEVIEDVILPPIFIAKGRPEIAALLWAGHTEPVMYPLYFGVRKVIKNIKHKDKNIYFLPMRTQPPHIGHINMLEAACNEADKVIIGVGSTNKHNKKNPYTANERKKMLDYSLKEKGLKNYEFVKLYDFDNDKDWVQHVKSKIPKNSTVISGNEWVTNIFNNLNIKTKKPEEVINSKLEDICATDLREMLVNGNPAWKQYAASGTIKYFEEFGGKKRIISQ